MVVVSHFNPRSHRGGNHLGSCRYLACSHFNPRPSVGSNIYMSRKQMEAHEFQSSHPSRVQLAEFFIGQFVPRFQSSLPPLGATIM